jgi:hypothetical protein
MIISIVETGFLLHEADQPSDNAIAVKWQHIAQITAFKRDCFSYHLICLAVADDRTIVEICEEDAGWDAFLQAAQTILPGLVPADVWLAEIAQPQFGSSSTNIYRKDQSSSQFQ